MDRAMNRAALAAFLVVPTLAWGQGLLVVTDPGQCIRLPRPIPMPTPPPGTYKIKELDVQARLTDQVAQVQVSQAFVNTGSAPLEVAFIFPLPYDGAIDRLTLMVDGKEVPAELMDAAAARSLYESIVRKNRDPALLEWMGTGLFKTSVFPVPPGAERKVSLRYTQLCRKDHGLTDFLFPLSTARYTSHPVEKIGIRLTIDSSAPIKNVYSPTHAVEIQRPDDKHATVSFTSTNQVPGSDFRLFFDAVDGKLAARVLTYRPIESEDGYLLLLASPEIKAPDQERPKKTVVFVIDKSGSMTGQKIEQARAALKFVLNNLREGDLFNIVAYDDKIESFRPELQRYDDDTRKAALGFAEGIQAGGSTNIDGALAAALAQLKDPNRPSYVAFLTDGLPTAGEKNESKIVVNARVANQVRARVFSFGVGYDVNSRLLDKLVRENFGQSEYVRPDEDIEAHVGKLYNRIGSPVMTDVAVKFIYDTISTEEGEPVNRIFPRGTFDLFEGEQMVLVARYRKSGAVKVTAGGKVGGQAQAFDFKAELVQKSADQSYGFIEKLWAMRRIGDIIDEIDLKGHNDELVKELVALSTKHGILTPYTSFLANENVDLRALTANMATCNDELARLRTAEGVGGFSQRSQKSAFQQALRVAPSGQGGGRGTAGGASAYLGVQSVRDDADNEVVIESCRSVGNKAFFRRDARWVDSTVTEEQEKNAVAIVQFSDDYFKLASSKGRDLAQYLAFDEPVLVNLDGVCYRIDPPK